VSKSGKVCYPWKSQTTFSFNSFHEKIEAENFCRNPGNLSSEPWCFVGNSIEKRESCDIPICDKGKMLSLIYFSLKII